VKTIAGEPLISTKPFAVTKCSAWLVSNEFPVSQAPSPVILKSATVSLPTLLSSSPYNPVHKNTKVTDTLCSQYCGENKQRAGMSRGSATGGQWAATSSWILHVWPHFTSRLSPFPNSWCRKCIEKSRICAPVGIALQLEHSVAQRERAACPQWDLSFSTCASSGGISHFQRRKLPASRSMDPRNVPYYMDCGILQVEGFIVSTQCRHCCLRLHVAA